jgi:hypothetical protein
VLLCARTEDQAAFRAFIRDLNGGQLRTCGHWLKSASCLNGKLADLVEPVFTFFSVAGRGVSLQAPCSARAILEVVLAGAQSVRLFRLL